MGEISEMAGDVAMNILDRFTSIDDLLVKLLERIGGVTEEDTHFFSYPNDGTRATITKGTTKLDFMAGTVMTPAGIVSNLGNSLRARGREYCRSLSLQADRDIIIQIGTKSKIPVFAGTWFKVAHLRFTDVKIVAAETTRIFVIACTNPDSIEMAGETYVKDPVDVWGRTTTIGNAELAVRTHAPPITFDRRGDVLRWVDFESPTRKYDLVIIAGAPVFQKSNETAYTGDFSYRVDGDNSDKLRIAFMTNDFHDGRTGANVMFSSDGTDYYITTDLYHYSGTTLSAAGLKYDRDAEKLYYLNSGGTYTEIGDLECLNNKYNFSTFKVVADFATGKYVRAVCFGNEYDLSAHDLFTTADGTARHLKCFTGIRGITAGGYRVYVDNIILTENEPI